MKRLTAILLSAALLISLFTGVAFAENSSYLELVLAACGEPIFDGSKGEALSAWGWEPAYKNGMSLSTVDGVNYLQFRRTSDYTGGGNLVLSRDIAEATNAKNSDFVVLSFLSFSELQNIRNEYEHIYTFYGDSTNTAGKEVLKFKYRVRGIMPCTAENQDKDEYGGAIFDGNGVPVRIFLIRDSGRLKYIYQVYNNGWTVAYEGSTDAARFADGLGTIRGFVQFGGENVPAGFGNLQIYAGKLENVKEPARYMENLDRGLAVMKADGRIYLSWRLLGTEDYDTAYEVYRNGEIIATVGDTTNYIDPEGTMEDEYSIAPVGGRPCEARKAFSSGENYFDIPLSKPAPAALPDGRVVEYTPWDATTGDLDGDGEYEIIQRWDAPRIHAGQDGYTGSLILDAYKLDGTVLWRIDLGVNIRCNTENVFSVYDYNGDGIAEIAAKTAPGSKDGTGRYVTEASLIDSIRKTDNGRDYRGSNGTVLAGPEFYTLFDGRNGKALDTVYYPIPRGDGNDFKVWGDNYGHRSEKYFDVPAYLDGVHPYIVLWRGIYPGQSNVGPGRTGVAAFRVENNRLQLEYSFDTRAGKPGYVSGNEKYIGQGNHNISVGDVDGDGLDEIITGGLCLDNDLTPLWSSGRGHGDALHLANYDPTTPGLEFMTVHEDAPHGMTVYNAATGETLGHWDGSGDTGRGVMANVGAGGYYQIWGAGTYQNNGGKNFSETNLNGQSYNFRIFWDGDTYDELLDAKNVSRYDYTPYISSYNSANGWMEQIFLCRDTETINNTKGTPALTADILGDWREEVIAVSEYKDALRVYISPIYTENKVYTLMHDSQYRQSIAWEHQFYNQPPHIGFYLSGNNDEYDERTKKPNITVVKYSPMPFESALPVERGTLRAQDENNVMDIDGDYFHSAEILSWQGGSRTLGNTTLAVSPGNYAFAAAVNLKHDSVSHSWGLEAFDKRFMALAANGDANATFTVSGERAVHSGKLHYNFSMPKTYSNNNGVLRERGGDNATLRIGSELSLFYDRDTTSLSLNGEVIHTYDGLDDAQRWTALDADIDALNGSIRLKLTFPGGEVYEKDYKVSLRPIGEISFTTYYWGCVLIDNVTLSSDDEALWLSNAGGSFVSHDFDPVSGRFMADFDLIPYEIADGVIGLADAAATWYSGLNIGLQLSSDGLLKARNGGAFAAVQQIRYAAGKKYHIHIEGNTKTKKYSAKVTDENGKIYTLATDYAFRADAPSASSLSRLYLLGGDGVGGGKFSVSNFTAVSITPGIVSAEIRGSSIAVVCCGEMTLYAAQYDSKGKLISVRKKKFPEGPSEASIVLESGCASVTLYAWNDALVPLTLPVTLKK